MTHNHIFEYKQLSVSQIDANNQSLINLIRSDNSPNLVDYSPIPSQSMSFISNMLANANHHKKRAFGCMMGMVCGDALGAPLEFTPINYKPTSYVTHMIDAKHFNLRAGQYTDDTSMGLCIADSLIVKGKIDSFDIMLRFLAWWHCGYNNCFRYDDKNKLKSSVGLGGNISNSLSDFIKYGNKFTKYGDCNTSGNGSIMRNAPICVACHKDCNIGMEYAMTQSRCTHQGIEAYECARLLTFICVSLINDNTIHINTLIQSYVPYTSHQNIMALVNSCDDWNWKNPHFRYNKKREDSQPKYIGSYSTDCLAMALHCVYTTNSFKSAVVKAVNFGGDADSVGSVTGQIAGSLYGYDAIPFDWIQSTHYWNGGSILYKAHLLYEQT